MSLVYLLIMDIPRMRQTEPSKSISWWPIKGDLIIDLLYIVFLITKFFVRKICEYVPYPHPYIRTTVRNKKISVTL